MILSALLTSVGINLGLCLLYLTLFSIFKKQPGNVYVYAPRLVAEGKARQENDFNLERLIPSVNWVKRAWQVTEDELLSISGFDAIVLMRIIIFSLRVFSFAAVVGIFVLLPFNYMGNQLSFDFIDLSTKSLDSFSVSNVDDGSNRLWIHFAAVYVFTAFVCYLLYTEYNSLALKRVEYFYASKPRPHQFTVLVRSIPVSSARSISDTVDTFFSDRYPSTYHSHSLVRRTSKIQGLVNDGDKVYKKLARLKSSNQTNQKFTRSGFLGIFGKKVNMLDHYEKKLENIEENVRTEQSSVFGKEVAAAFVCFKTRFAAAAALHIRQAVDPTEWVTEPAPDPQDVHWPFFSASFFKLWISSFLVLVACILLTILFLIPVFIVQGLANLKQLETWFPFLQGVLNITVVSEVITGYLPSFILQEFLSLVPPVMIALSSMQGYIALSQIQKSACIKVLIFTIWNIFFANVLSGTALYRAYLVFEPKKIPEILALGVPGQATFFISYVVTSGWTKTAENLFRLIPIVKSFVKRKFLGYADDDFEVPSVPFHSEIPRILFFGLLGITYFFLAPLILPFIVIYYCMAYIIYRNQLLNLYAPKYETGGKFWPIVHDSTIFSLLLMHVIAIGIFGLKQLPLASSLIVPLPVLTLIFNSYCHRRFRPIFKSYAAESLVKKDREEEADRSINGFRDKLTSAYEDPNLMPVQYSSDNGRLTSPLLGSAQA